MKKIYTKPEIFFESFSMSTNIAGDCENTFPLPTDGVCAIPDANGVNSLFNVDATGTQCDAYGFGFEEYDGLCYHAPDETRNLFNS